MTDADWHSPGSKSIAVYVDGTVAPDLDARGRPMLDDDLLILVNGSPQPVTFTIPEVGKRCSWRAEVDSFDLGADTADSHTARANDTADASAHVASMADEACRRRRRPANGPPALVRPAPRLAVLTAANRHFRARRQAATCLSHLARRRVTGGQNTAGRVSAS